MDTPDKLNLSQREEWDKISPPNKEKRIRRLVVDIPFVNFHVISYGFIVYAKDTGRSVIVQRKHSAEFLLIMRGLYRLGHLTLILPYITSEEATIITKCINFGPMIFKDIYFELGLSTEELEYALIRMAEMRNIILELLPKLDLTNNYLSWNWPKGRLNISPNKEIPFECAKREFLEETELSLPPPVFISDDYIIENVRTITGRNIESRYWIYVIPNEIPLNPPNNHPEVSSRMWTIIDKCEVMLSHKTLLCQVNDIVSKL